MFTEKDYIPGISLSNMTQRKLACVLNVDTSGSMSEGIGYATPIKEVEQGLESFKRDLECDSMARMSVDCSIVGFDSEVSVLQDFSKVQDIVVPNLEARGTTSMCSSIISSLDMIERRKEQYKSLGVSYYRPWLWLFTDGEPTDMHKSDEMYRKLERYVKSKKVHLYIVCVNGCNKSRMLDMFREYATILDIKGSSYGEFFKWLSSSMAQIPASRVGEKVIFDAVPENVNVINVVA